MLALLVLHQEGFVVKVQKGVFTPIAVDEEDGNLLAGVDQLGEMGFHVWDSSYIFKIMGCRVNPRGPEGFSCHSIFSAV